MCGPNWFEGTDFNNGLCDIWWSKVIVQNFCKETSFTYFGFVHFLWGLQTTVGTFCRHTGDWDKWKRHEETFRSSVMNPDKARNMPRIRPQKALSVDRPA